MTQKSRYDGDDLRRKDFRREDLSNVTFSNVDMSNVNMKEADLSDSVIRADDSRGTKLNAVLFGFLTWLSVSSPPYSLTAFAP